MKKSDKKSGRCWRGYKPKKGSTPYAPGSCVKEANARMGKVLANALGLTEEEEKITDLASANRHIKDKQKNFQTEFENFYKKDEPKTKTPKKPKIKDHTTYQDMGRMLAEMKGLIKSGLKTLAKTAVVKKAVKATGDAIAKSGSKDVAKAETGEASGESPEKLAKTMKTAGRKLKMGQAIRSFAGEDDK